MTQHNAQQLPALKTAITAATRALARKKNITVGFGAEVKGATIALPALTDLPTPEGLAQLRGMADAQASAIRFHDKAVHKKLRPTVPANANLYDMLEQIRLESQIGVSKTGVRYNLTQRYIASAMQQGMGTPAARLELLARRHILAQAIPDFLKSALEKAESDYASILPQLATLTAQTSAQQHYAEQSLSLIDAFSHLAGSTDPSVPSEESSGENEAESEIATQPEGSESDAMNAASGGDDNADEVPVFMKKAGGAPPDALPQQGQEVAGSSNPYPYNRSQEQATAPYHAYSTQYDEVVGASHLATPTELAYLRDQLDQKLLSLQTVTAKLASKLQRLLLAKQARRWLYDESDGILDSKKLARLITTPGIETIYKREQDTEFRDTVVTLLIDNSGSMRGRPITIAAISADIISRTLERCGVKVEILGFTTREWKGGAAYKQWVKDGKPAQPGRLNELRHIIYKSADMHYRKAAKQLGLMLKDGILKENIDGEAILWACDRLLARPEQRRILMVISDGAPVDDSTLSTNNSNYLDAHLREVIAHVENKLPIELLAIGIGHDVTRYYKRAVTISDIDKLGETMTEQLTELFK
ncbi:MAG: cobaltochelatase subunit CobT [Alphaproteobacteria bacterium]|nr:cobaltochelatase subunit CobT [Alphaproteobacteria bacterium]